MRNIEIKGNYEEEAVLMEENDQNVIKTIDNIGHQLTTDVNFRKTIWVNFVKGIK